MVETSTLTNVNTWRVWPTSGSEHEQQPHDEEGSLSSTVSGSGMPPKNQEDQEIEQTTPSSPDKESGERSVWFDEGANQRYQNTLYSEEEVPGLWYSDKDYDEFKTSNTLTARMIYQAEGADDCPSPFSYTGVLEDVYLACCHLKKPGYTDDDDGDHHFDELAAGLILSDTQDDRLRRLFQADQGHRLGLERRSIKSLSRDKSQRRQELVRVLYHVQLARSYRDDDVLAKELRRKCRSVSSPHRLFARSLGYALQQSLRQEERYEPSVSPK